MTVKNVEKLEKSRVALEIEVGAEEFEAAVQKAYLKVRSKVSVPGFRPGKAPRKMIEKLYGADVFYADAVDEAFPEAYEQAVESEKLDTIGYPEVEMVGDVTKDGFTFKATVAVYPEVKLGEYKGVSVPKEEVKVTADDVKERLNEMAERNARLVSVERKAKKGDTAVIDFEGFLDGTPFEGGKGENYELELGSGSFVPGFEDQVIGMKAGEEKDVDITFPEDYQKDLAGKAVVFKVKCNEVKVKELPAIDDEFAKDVSEFDTLKELKDDIKKQIESDREQAVKVAYENALIEKVADSIECEIPEALIEAQCKRFLEEFKSRIMAQGIPYDQYAKMTGMDEKKPRARHQAGQDGSRHRGDHRAGEAGGHRRRDRGGVQEALRLLRHGRRDGQEVPRRERGPHAGPQQQGCRRRGRQRQAHQGRREEGGGSG